MECHLPRKEKGCILKKFKLSVLEKVSFKILDVKIWILRTSIIIRFKSSVFAYICTDYSQ